MYWHAHFLCTERGSMSPMKQQFVVIDTVPQTEVPALLDS